MVDWSWPFFILKERSPNLPQLLARWAVTSSFGWALPELTAFLFILVSQCVVYVFPVLPYAVSFFWSLLAVCTAVCGREEQYGSVHGFSPPWQALPHLSFLILFFVHLQTLILLHEAMMFQRLALAACTLLLASLHAVRAQSCAAYSFSTSTDSASTQYQLCPVLLQGGYTYSFYTCGSTVDDTYIRLWNPSNTAVRVGAISFYFILFYFCRESLSITDGFSLAVGCSRQPVAGHQSHHCDTVISMTVLLVSM